MLKLIIACAVNKYNFSKLKCLISILLSRIVFQKKEKCLLSLLLLPIQNYIRRTTY